MYQEDGVYDRERQLTALRLIITYCPAQAARAAEAIRVEGDAARQMRLDRLIPEALRAAAPEMEIADREVLANAMHGGEPGGG